MKSEHDIEKIKEAGLNNLKDLYQQIIDTAEAVVPLYDAVENYFFQDIDYQKIKPFIPLWMIDVGRSPESGITKDFYEQLRSEHNDALSNRILHWADVQGILSAFQDRVMSVRNYLEIIYKYLPTYCLYEDDEYTKSTRVLDETSDKVHTAINNVFVSLCSSFDLFTKVVYECSKYDIDSFSNYKRLKCRKDNILYKKGNYGFDEMKADGLLYSEPVCVRTACSFRDEFIHNGTWDERCAIYYPYLAGDNPAEPFVVMPDVDEEGLLVSSGSRNKFYSKSTKVNVFLLEFVKEVMEVLANTIELLVELLRKRVVASNKEESTDKALIIMLRNQIISSKKLMGDKYSDECLVNDVDLLMAQFPKTYQIIAELCKDRTLTKEKGELLLYCTNGRPYRMLMFVLLLKETANLKNDAELGYHLLKEAYLMTDNIYGQLQHTTYSFVLTDYLTELETLLPNRNPNELEAEEKAFYDKLPNNFKVYRGMCDEEMQSQQYGISWTLEQDYARNYVFYKKNEVKGIVGWIAEMEIDKNEIFAVWGIVGERKEIVINPTKCKNVNFIKIVKE